MHTLPEWIQLVSLAFCFGVIFCRLWFFTPSMQTKFSYPATFVPRMWDLFCFGLVAIIFLTIVELFVRSGEISGRPFPAFLPVVPTVLFHTHYGKVWLIRVAALIILSLSKTAVRYRDSRYFLNFMLALAIAVSITQSASGHASDKGDFSLPEIADLLHLAAACIWGGGLLVLSLSILPSFGRDDPQAGLVATVAGRFSKTAGIAVAVIAVTAFYNSWLYIGNYEALWRTPYGLAAAAKILLFLFLLGLGGFNRYVSVTALRNLALSGSGRSSAGVINSPGRSPVLVRFRRLVAVEAVLIIAVLLCAAILRHEIPARHLSHMGHQKGITLPPGHMH